MDTELKIIANNEVDAWLESLYKETVDIEFEGRILRFKSRFPSKLAFQMQSLPKEQLFRKIIAILSVQPLFTEEQVEKMPQDLLYHLGAELMGKLQLDPEKKKDPRKPNLST